MTAQTTADHIDTTMREHESARPATFEELATTLVPELKRYFARRIQPIDDAADCVSETTLAMWRHREKLPTEHSEQRAWAYGIARKILANYIRKRARRLGVEATSYRERAEPRPVPDESDQAFAAVEALRLLSSRDQELLRMVVWDDLSLNEAATVLGISAPTARKRYERARRRLQEKFSALWPLTE